ncbi:MAG: hypothetical protein QOE09_756 [Ilumatobacteraceae bacterium]
MERKGLQHLINGYDASAVPEHGRSQIGSLDLEARLASASGPARRVRMLSMPPRQGYRGVVNSGPSGYNGSSNAMGRPSTCPVTGTTFGSAAERPCVQLAATDRCPVLPLSVVNVMSIVGLDPSNG